MKRESQGSKAIEAKRLTAVRRGGQSELGMAFVICKPQVSVITCATIVTVSDPRRNYGNSGAQGGGEEPGVVC